MKNITLWRNNSLYITPLSKACRMCEKGSKMVLFVTGLCSTNCFYCPLSSKKAGKDRIFADEWELENEQDTNKLIQEAENIEATGAGITGGDPLLVWNRVQTYITLLKNTFGEKFNIHLYTSALKNAEHVLDLIASGLDEVRFHPLPYSWKNMEKNPIKKTIKNVIQTNADVAIEIPAIPKMEQDILSLITWADTQGIRWINLNELEFSESNCHAFLSRGYQVKDEICAGVQGSEQTAIRVIEKAQKKDLHIGLHYCSVSFKDGIQLKNRLKRRANHTQKPYDVVTEDGTIIKGIIYSNKKIDHHLTKLIQKTYNIPAHLIYLDNENKRIEIASWLLQKIATKLTKQGYRCFIVEEYPTADRLEVERIPLPFM